MLMYLTLIESEDEKIKFEKIYLEYRQIMFSTAKKILRDTYLAEDIVQKGFLKIIPHLNKIDENSKVKTNNFLIIVIENLCIDLYRKDKNIELISYEELLFEKGIEIVDTKSNTIDADLKNSKLMECMMRLPIHYYSLLQLKYIYGYDYKEISQLLNISEQNARQRMLRAKKQLKNYLEKGEL